MLGQTINFRVDAKMANLIKKAAQAQDRRVSDYLRRIVARAVISDLASAEDTVVDRDNGDNGKA